MSRLRGFAAGLCALLLFGYTSTTLAATAPGPRLSAVAAVLLDPDTGELVYAREAHRSLPPASTTKVLTTLIALERLPLDAEVTVGAEAAGTPPSRIGLRTAETISVRDLLYGVMLKSGNDAAAAVAQAVSGSVAEFGELMTARAHQIGARDTQFRNPHGLPDDAHYTTAYDLAVMFRHAMLNPEFIEIAQTDRAQLRIELAGDSRHRSVPVRNHNRLLATDDGAIGGKTGYTDKAQRCYVGAVERGGRRLIVAILGSKTLWEDTGALLDYGFEQWGIAATPKPAPKVATKSSTRRKGGDRSSTKTSARSTGSGQRSS